MAKIRYIEDKEGGIVLPVTHERAVIDSNGTTMESKIAGKQDVIDSTHKLDYSLLSNTPTIPDVSGKEDASNKVTSLSSSSTDTQYPSAKCVYDIIGDVETLLAAI